MNLTPHNGRRLTALILALCLLLSACADPYAAPEEPEAPAPVENKSEGQVGLDEDQLDELAAAADRPRGETKVCPVCHAEVDADALFCNHCGAQL